MAELKKILIAGAGLGGLAAAVALLKRGFDVEVYEQAAELKEVGSGVQISANGTGVLFALGLEEKVRHWGVRAVDIGDTVKKIDGSEVPILTPWRR